MNKNFKYLLLSLSLFAVLFQVGCKKRSEEQAAQSTASGAQVKIGFILDNMNEERYQKDKKFFEEKAQQIGATVMFASANSDVANQINKVENMLASGVKAIVVQPVDSKASAPIVEMAHKEKVPVIAYDRVIYGASVDLYVTQNSFEVGVLQAKAAVQATGGKGNYVILSGQQGHSVAEAITSGVMSVLQPHIDRKEITVVQRYHPGWSAELALRTVEDALTNANNNIDAILANNSGMAHGAVQAVAEQKKDLDAKGKKIFIAGADADLSSIKDMVAGKQQFEVLKDIRPLAEAAAEAAVLLAQGKPIQFDQTMENGSGSPIKVKNTPVYDVTPQNLDERVFSTGFHDRAAVYGEKNL